MGSDVTVPSPGSVPTERDVKSLRRGSPIFGFLTFVVLPLAALIGYFRLSLPDIIAENERRAAQALKSIAMAEADFRSNDRDGNLENDFWTGDVSGLYSIIEHGRPTALIDRDVALADVAPLRRLVSKPVAYHGYYFVALENDCSSGIPDPYKKATDSRMGNVHNHSAFGFCAFPESYGRTGRFTFVINEGNTMFRWDTRGVSVDHWPSDEEWESHSRIHRRVGEPD